MRDHSVVPGDMSVIRAAQRVGAIMLETLILICFMADVRRFLDSMRGRPFRGMRLCLVRQED